VATRYTQPQAGPLTPNPEWAPQFLIAPNGGAISDAVLPSQVSTLYGGAAVSIAQTGAVLKLTGGTTYASLPSSNNYNILGEITLLWYGIIDDATQYNFLLARFVGNGGDHNPFELRIDAGGVARLTRSGAAATPYFSVATTSAIPSGVPVCLVVTSGADLSSGVSSFYINGLPVSSSVAQYGNTGPALGNTEPLLLGTREDFYTYAKTRTALAAGFPKILLPAQIAAVSANPWQLFKAPRRVLKAASGGGTAVNPGAGSIALTGYAPTLAQTANVALVPGAGSLAITGYAPAVTQGGSQSVGPGVGSIAITGYAPTIAQPHAVAPGVGSIALTGYAPTLAQTANQALTPGAGSIALTGYAPTVTQAALSQSLVPGVGTLTITGYAPTVVQTGQQKNSAGFPYKKLPRMVWEQPPRVVIVQKSPEQSEIPPAAKHGIVQTIERAKLPRYASPFMGEPTRISSFVRPHEHEDEEEELLLLV